MFRGKTHQGLRELEVDIAGVLEGQHDPDVQVVDCREPDEWDAGHLEGSRLIPLDSLTVQKHELDPSRPVVVVCRSGQRSLRAAEILQASGFRNARSLAGGLIAWVNSGHKLVQQNSGMPGMTGKSQYGD